MLEFAGFDPGVLPLGISFEQFFHRHVQKDLVERNPLVFVAFPNIVAVFPVGTNEAHQGNDPAVRKQRGQLTRSTNGFGPIPFRESQVSVQTRSEVVSVEPVHVFSIILNEDVFQCRCNGGLSSSGAPRHPQGCSLLSECGESRFFGQMTGTLRLSGLRSGTLNNVRRCVAERLLPKTAHQGVVVLWRCSSTRSCRHDRSRRRCFINGFDDRFRTVARLHWNRGGRNRRFGRIEPRRRHHGLGCSRDNGIHGFADAKALDVCVLAVVDVCVAIHQHFLVHSGATQDIDDCQQHTDTHAHGHPFLYQFIFVVGGASSPTRMRIIPSAVFAALFLNGKRGIRVFRHG
mmetsp:Transcript_19111/g.39251  ORF Transcript_19111/g.39251 Transcript_19111/m.39251 type:complete len:345 (-) Transcript_19111:101-1135(-)